MINNTSSTSDEKENADRKAVFTYLGQLLRYADEHGVRFSGRSPEAALASKDNIRIGQWVARAILELARKELRDCPLPSPDVCELLGLNALKESLLDRGA